MKRYWVTLAVAVTAGSVLLTGAGAVPHPSTFPGFADGRKQFHGGCVLPENRSTAGAALRLPAPSAG